MIKIYKNKILYFPRYGRVRNLSRKMGGIFRNMNDAVEVEENVTFGDIFKFLIKDKEHVKFIFSASLYGIPFDSLIEDFKKKARREEPCELTYLEIIWETDCSEKELKISTDFHGYGISEEGESMIPYGLDFTKISKLKNLPIKLNEDFEIIREGKNSRKDRVLLKTTKSFTLFEIINAILYELTWWGTPEMRDKTWKEILEYKREIGSPKIKTKPVERLFKNKKEAKSSN